MPHVGTVVLFVMLFAYFVAALICRVMADRHRRRVPEWAWKAAGVDRLFWGLRGTNIYVPFSDLYYLARVRNRLDRAEDIQDGSPAS